METKETSQKKTFLEMMGELFYADYLFKREMVNRKHSYRIMQKDEANTCRLVAFIAIIVELIFFLQDIIHTRTIFDNVGFYFASEGVIVAFSIAMILSYKFLIKTRKYKMLRAACFLYYCSIIVGSMLFMCGNLLERPESLSFGFLFFMVLSFVPSTYLIDNFILFGLAAGSISISTFVISGVTAFWYKYYLVLFLFMFIALVFRSSQVRSTIYKVKESEMNEVIKIQTYTDTLTCALNRRALEELLSDNFDSWRANNENVALLMFDVDNFKEYNDNFSHLTGDEVLKLVASTASQLCNRNMPNVFRYGGDEFFMVIVGCDRLDVLTKSLDLLRSVAKLKINRVRNQELYLTISVGVTMLNNKIDSPSEFISSVDEELYFAKNNGKACVAFENKIYR